MKSLYESILSSTKAGKNGYIRKLLFSQPVNSRLLDEEWRKLSLGYDAGDGEGQWMYNPFTRTYDYRITTLKPGKERKEYVIALTNPDTADLLVIVLREEIGKRKLQKWAEKIARILNLQIEYDKNYLHLKFI